MMIVAIAHTTSRHTTSTTTTTGTITAVTLSVMATVGVLTIVMIVVVLVTIVPSVITVAVGMVAGCDMLVMMTGSVLLEEVLVVTVCDSVAVGQQEDVVDKAQNMLFYKARYNTFFGCNGSSNSDSNP